MLKFLRKKKVKIIARTLGELKPDIYYGVDSLEAILKGLNLKSSIFSIRDYETWKCIDYNCGKRHDYKVRDCERCGGAVRERLIISPRTRGGGRGPGHRRYTAGELRQVVEVFRQRR